MSELAVVEGEIMPKLLRDDCDRGIDAATANGSVPPFNNINHWRRCAEKARALAERMVEPEVRKAMLDIADNCDQLMKRIEQRLEEKPIVARPRRAL